jgi:SAM-dependent methyltransferase
MEDLKQALRNLSGQDLEQRKHWYSPAAEAYQQARPRYPDALIQQVITIAQLSSESTLLEVGCGPAIATLSFAPLECSMLCLEPNPDFYRMAQENCAPYPQIELQNLSFEEWIPARKFDAVLAASSFHWIPAEIGYPKAAEILNPDGVLILLWNKELQPQPEIYQEFSKLYQQYAPALDRYEDQATQSAILQQLGAISLDSGHFKHLVTGQVECEVTYSADQYLMLLNTYSPYLKLDPVQKQPLFEGIHNVIERQGGSIPLSYLSAFHIAKAQG